MIRVLHVSLAFLVLTGLTLAQVAPGAASGRGGAAFPPVVTGPSADQRYVFYLDIGSRFLDEKGYFLPDTFRGDNLHPEAKGYDIWGAAVQDKLAELMK